MTYLDMQVISQCMLHWLDQERHKVLALVVGIADHLSDAMVLRRQAIKEHTVAKIVAAVRGKDSELLRKLHEDRRQVLQRSAIAELLGQLDVEQLSNESAATKDDRTASLNHWLTRRISPS